MHAEFTAKQSNSVIVTQSQTAAKLPKLVILKFDGSYMNWPKFWGQFTEAIDKSSIAPITKFTYLLELLEPKAKQCVEALPFNLEGYNRAKAILVDKFGKESEIVKVYVKQILDLPNVPGTNPRVTEDFYENLTHSVQALETMGKLSQIDGNVSMTLDKLSGIRGDLVRVDPDWEMWDFGKLCEALHQWVKQNPVESCGKRDREECKRLLYTQQDRQEGYRPRGCVYCGNSGHKATHCDTVTEPSERKHILSSKGLCFNCAVKTHRAAECSSKTACGHCNQSHHTSICDKRNAKNDENSNKKKLVTVFSQSLSCTLMGNVSCPNRFRRRELLCICSIN